MKDSEIWVVCLVIGGFTGVQRKGINECWAFLAQCKIKVYIVILEKNQNSGLLKLTLCNEKMNDRRKDERTPILVFVFKIDAVLIIEAPEMIDLCLCSLPSRYFTTSTSTTKIWETFMIKYIHICGMSGFIQGRGAECCDEDILQRSSHHDSWFFCQPSSYKTNLLPCTSIAAQPRLVSLCTNESLSNLSCAAHL